MWWMEISGTRDLQPGQWPLCEGKLVVGIAGREGSRPRRSALGKPLPNSGHRCSQPCPVRTTDCRSPYQPLALPVTERLTVSWRPTPQVQDSPPLSVGGGGAGGRTGGEQPGRHRGPPREPAPSQLADEEAVMGRRPRDGAADRAAVRVAAERLLAGTPLHSTSGKLTASELIAESEMRRDVVYRHNNLIQDCSTPPPKTYPATLTSDRTASAASGAPRPSAGRAPAGTWSTTDDSGGYSISVNSNRWPSAGSSMSRTS